VGEDDLEVAIDLEIGSSTGKFNPSLSLSLSLSHGVGLSLSMVSAKVKALEVATFE